MIDDLVRAPRQCVTGPSRMRRWKKRFNSPAEISNRVKNERNSVCYLCENCNKYHIGHVRKDTS